VSRFAGIAAILILLIAASAASYYFGVNIGHSTGYLEGQTYARSQVETEVHLGYELGYRNGYDEAVRNPPVPEPQGNIRIRGETGTGWFSTSYMIYLQSNPTESSGYYSVWRYVYDPSNYYYKVSDFDSLDKIKERCTFLGRRAIDANSLIYSDVGVQRNNDYVYVVTQDDNDFSNPLQFK
jgi:hypothetical protein